MNNGYILCAIAKNEMPYIKEFVEYHLGIGFDKIFIGDNNDIDGERYDEILSDYIKYDKVEIFPLRGMKSMQLVFYNFILKKEFEWCAFIDLDEYITFGENSKYTNIKDFLDLDDSVGIYKVNWRVYGDNGYIRKEEGKLIDRFKDPKSADFCFHYRFPENYHTKSIISGKARDKVIWKSQPHTPYLNQFVVIKDTSGKICNNSPFNDNINYDNLYIRHFYTKSLEEWIDTKYHRGYADNNMAAKELTYPIDDFFIYNEKTQEKLDYLKEIGIAYE